MTMFDFSLLSRSEQADLLYNEGVYVGKQKRPGQTILLYQLKSFYAEIYYHRYRSHVTRIHCFTSTTLLDPYLKDISLEELVGS
jgi:hypothetical protein